MITIKVDINCYDDCDQAVFFVSIAGDLLKVVGCN